MLPTLSHTNPGNLENAILQLNPSENSGQQQAIGPLKQVQGKFNVSLENQNNIVEPSNPIQNNVAEPSSQNNVVELSTSIQTSLPQQSEMSIPIQSNFEQQFVPQYTIPPLPPFAFSQFPLQHFLPQSMMMHVPFPQHFLPQPYDPLFYWPSNNFIPPQSNPFINPISVFQQQIPNFYQFIPHLSTNQDEEVAPSEVSNEISVEENKIETVEEPENDDDQKIDVKIVGNDEAQNADVAPVLSPLNIQIEVNDETPIDPPILHPETTTDDDDDEHRNIVAPIPSRLPPLILKLWKKKSVESIQQESSTKIVPMLRKPRRAYLTPKEKSDLKHLFDLVDGYPLSMKLIAEMANVRYNQARDYFKNERHRRNKSAGKIIYKGLLEE